jgi:hypothetical protein
LLTLTRFKPALRDAMPVVDARAAEIDAQRQLRARIASTSMTWRSPV